MGITKVKGQPITGSRSAMRAVRPVLADQKNTSVDLQRNVMQPPQPFANPNSTGQSTGVGRTNVKRWGIPFDKPAPVNARTQNYGKRTGVANTSLSAQEMAAVGYGANDTKSSNPIISGRPTRNNQRVVGGGDTPRATGGNGQNMRRGNARVGTQETGAVRGDNQGTRNYMNARAYTERKLYTDGVKEGSRSRGAALTSRSKPKAGAPFYFQK